MRSRTQNEQHTTVTVQHVYELADTGQAFEQFTTGTLGKLVIAIGPSAQENRT